MVINNSFCRPAKVWMERSAVDIGKTIKQPLIETQDLHICGNLTLFSNWRDVLDACGRYAQVIVQWEAVTVQHLGPGESKRGHHGRAAVLDALAQGPARLDGLVQVVQADRSEEGAQELSRVGVALLLDERDPRRGLLQDLVHRFVSEQVREAHLRVLYVVAQEEVCGDRLAVILFVE